MVKYGNSRSMQSIGKIKSSLKPNALFMWIIILCKHDNRIKNSYLVPDQDKQKHHKKEHRIQETEYSIQEIRLSGHQGAEIRFSGIRIEHPVSGIENPLLLTIRSISLRTCLRLSIDYFLAVLIRVHSVSKSLSLSPRCPRWFKLQFKTGFLRPQAWQVVVSTSG